MSVAGELATRIADTREEQSDQALISELEGKYAEAEQAQRDLEKIWAENIAFLEGIQWLRTLNQQVINTAGLVKGGRQRITDNRLLDFTRRLISRMVQVQYRPEVTADTDDPGDKKSAKAARGALRWFERRKKVAQRKLEAAWWIAATDICYIETYFDPDAGPMREVPVVDEAGDVVYEDDVDEAGMPILEVRTETDPVTGTPVAREVPRQRPVVKMEPVGEVNLTVRSPFQVKRDWRFQEWEKVRWVFVDEEAAVEEVVDRFGNLIPGLADKLGAGGKSQPLPWIPALPTMGVEDQTGLPKPIPAVSGTVTVRRFYEKPSKRYPKGRMVIYAADPQVMLWRGELDTPDGDLPLVPLSYLSRPWSLEGRSPVRDGKILQRLYNRILSRYAEHLIRLPAGWLLVPTTSGIPKRGFTNEIASIIRYQPAGGAPSFVFPPFQGLAWYDTFLQRLENSMEERMALPPAARGQMPKGARAARTIELLQEAADAVQAPVLSGIAWAWVSVYEKVLGLMHRHYTLPRMIAIEGEANIAEVLEFQGDLLPRDWRDRLSVKVEAGESLPSSRLARMELVLTLARVHQVFGQPGTPQYARRLREALELDSGFLPTDEDLDESMAEQENLVAIHGDLPPVHEWDDDPVHLRTHLTYLKRMAVAGRLDATGPLTQHVDMHRAQLARKVSMVRQPGLSSVMGPPTPGPGALPGVEPALPGAEPQEAPLSPPGQPPAQPPVPLQ